MTGVSENDEYFMTNNHDNGRTKEPHTIIQLPSGDSFAKGMTSKVVIFCYHVERSHCQETGNPRDVGGGEAEWTVFDFLPNHKRNY
jgi:hypothetical protein